MINRQFYEKHPKITLGFLIGTLFFVLDFSTGFFLCPRILGNPDAYYHHDLPRNVSGVKNWGERDYGVFTNSLGFIDRVVREVPRTSSRHRILLLGDSFTEGVGLEYDRTFAGIFENSIISLGGRDVEVLNAAVTSYAPKLYFLKTLYLLRNVGLDIDELIVFIDISDAQDEIVYELFTPSEGLGVSNFYFWNRVDSFLRQHSFSYYALRKFLMRGDIVFTAASQGSNLALDEEFNANFDRERDLWTVSTEVFRKWGEQGLQLGGYHMGKLVELCRENGISVTVAVYPWPRQIFAGDIDSIQVRYWRDFCKERGISFIDLFPYFFDGRPAEEVYRDYFIPGDVHWNAAGHRLVADTLFRKWSEGR